MGRDDFFVTAANEEAVARIDAWPDWPTHALVLSGPPGSGKSHLADVWATVSAARAISADAVRSEAVPELLASGALVVEEAPGEAPDERALFHLLNLARESRSHVLLVSRSDPAHWPVMLPDLRTRLLALDVVRLGAPDDALLRAVLVKQFHDRQVLVEEAVVTYMLSRMERSLEAARRLVDEIDRAALAEKARITRAFVARLMARRAEPDLFGTD